MFVPAAPPPPARSSLPAFSCTVMCFLLHCGHGQAQRAHQKNMIQVVKEAQQQGQRQKEREGVCVGWRGGEQRRREQWRSWYLEQSSVETRNPLLSTASGCVLTAPYRYPVLVWWSPAVFCFRHNSRWKTPLLGVSATKWKRWALHSQGSSARREELWWRPRRWVPIETQGQRLGR